MSRAVMQQALEALEEMWQSDKAQSAITALRAALAEPEQEPVVLNGIDCSCGRKWRITNNMLTVSEPKQEPVAWVEPKWLDPDTRGWPSDSFESVPIEGWLPPYTAPTPRKPLTDEEMRECAQAMNAEPLAEGWPELIKFARAIENKHGIGEQHE